MIKKAFLLIFVLLSLLITSCVTYERDITVPRLTFSNKENVPLEDFPYRSLRIVALETNDESLLREVREVRSYRSYLYVLDGGNELTVFSSEGRYVNRIGKRGNAAGEYTKLCAFFINEKEESISIIDEIKNKIYSYDLTGNFLHSVDLGTSVQYCDHSLMTEEGNILLNYSINFGENIAYSILDGSNLRKNVRFLPYSPITVNGYLYSFSMHPMCENSNGNIDFIMPLCDTIFEYSNKEYRPKYIVDIPGKMVDKKRFQTNVSDMGCSYSSMVFKYGNEGFFTGFTGIFETGKHLLLKYMHNGFLSGFYLADKESLEGNYYICTIPEVPVKIPLTDIVGTTDHEIIGVYNAEDIIALYHDMDKNNGKGEFYQLETVVQHIEEDSNPCLIFYALE